MPKQKDLKRLVRTRMRKTGESYTAARSQVVRTKTARRPEPERDLAAIAGMSDEAVKKKTNRDWRGWARVLDAAGAASMAHKDIARHLYEEHRLPGWWAQMVTVGYERFRGLRDKGQRRGGGYVVNKSKTFPVPVAKLYSAFAARHRQRWLGDARPTVKRATREKSMRVTWEDGTQVDVYFWAKGPAKSQVQLQHHELPDQAGADRLRAYWTGRLAALGQVLREGLDAR